MDLGTSNSANQRSQGMEASTSGGNELAVPPLEIGESFGQVYDVILILDQREQFRRDAKGYHCNSSSCNCTFSSNSLDLYCWFSSGCYVIGLGFSLTLWLLLMTDLTTHSVIYKC